MPDFFNFIKSFLPSSRHCEQQIAEGPECIDLTEPELNGKRKRQPSVCELRDKTKKRRVDMDNSDGVSDGDQGAAKLNKSFVGMASDWITNKSLSIKGWLRGSKSDYKVQEREVIVIDCTDNDTDDIKLRPPRKKEDLNQEIIFDKEIIRQPQSIQASPPSQLSEADEVTFIKNVDVIDLTQKEPTKQSLTSDPLKPASIISDSISESFRPIQKRLRLPITSYEKKKLHERNKPAVLRQSMKQGRTSKPRSTYEKFFSRNSGQKTGAGVRECFDRQGLIKYASLLNKHGCGAGAGTSFFRPGRKADYSRSLFRGVNDKTSLFSQSLLGKVESDTEDEVEQVDKVDSGEKDRTPLTGLASSTPAQPNLLHQGSRGVPPFPSLPSPLHVISEPKDEGTPFSVKATRKISTLEEENRKKDVYSPGYVSNLFAKYGSSARNRERDILEQERLASSLREENKKKYEEDINARLERYMRITSAILPEDDADEDEEEEDTELPEITPDMWEVINSALRARDNQQLIESHRIPICGKDISTLKGLTWLNDEIINFYMQMIVARGNTEQYEQVYAFNTFFYTTYRDNGYSKVKRWTKKVDIFSQSIILIPVHLGMHWCLATIDMKKKRVNYYDSMGGNNQSCLDLLLKYLEEEHMDKKKSEFDSSGWSSNILKDIPQQMNGSDCGMFACKFAEYVSRRAKITFTQENMPYFRKRMIFEIVKDTLIKP